MITVITYSEKSGYGRLNSSDLLPRISDEKHDMVWLDFEAPTSDEARLLASYCNFHPLAIEDCVTETLLPKVDDFGDYIFLVLHGIHKEQDGRLATTEINFFLGSTYLVTYHDMPSHSINEVRERCLKNVPAVARGGDFLLHDILDRMVDYYFPVIEQVEKTTEELELEVFDNPRRETLNKIVVLKKEVMRLRRALLPQRDILNRLSRDNFAVISAKSVAYYRDIYDHLARVSDMADSYRDQLNGTLEAYLSVVSNRLNEIMKLLTVFTATLMPLTLITGIYGMNFDNMPELRSPFGYFGVLGVMALIAVGMVSYFLKKKWL